MKLTNLLRVLGLSAALSTSSLFANTVTITDTAFDGGGDGGEFLAVTSANGTFYTFCLENFVHVGLPGTYTYTVSSRAFSGGPDAHDPVGAGPAGDPISAGTAWLYEQFFKGTLIDSDGVGNYSDNRSINAGLLQKAFWTLEDEYNYGSNYYVTLAVNHFGSYAAAAATAPASAKVKAMNLWGANGKDVQSQLVYVPDSGMTAALLALGLLSLAAFRRKS